MQQNFLLVDDDSINNILGTYNIQKVVPDSQVNSYQFPEEALEHIAQTYKDNGSDKQTILFLDINMPQLDGWEFLAEFSAMDPRIHQQFTIYMLSSSIDDADMKKARENPFVKDFISKPLKVETLQQILSLNPV